MSTPSPIEPLSALETKPAMGRDQARFPEWYPGWARALAEQYSSGTTCLFLIHGNVRDLFRAPGPDGSPRYLDLPEFLATQVFGSWDVVCLHDVARGLSPMPGENSQRLQSMVKSLSARLGEPTTWPRDPDVLLALLDRLIERNLLEIDPKNRKSMAFLFNYAQYLVPEGTANALSRGQATQVVRFLNWAHNPYLKRVNTAFCLINETLSELNERLVRSSHASTIAIPLPNREERKLYCDWVDGVDNASTATSFSLDELAEMSNGLSLVNLEVLLKQGRQSGEVVSVGQFSELKKTLIERQCHGLIEFIEPKYTLDLLVGQESAKQRLREDAELLLKGKTESAPMGYLFCGPVGTGKSFMAECYAGTVGIPCVKLRNFRSKYVGETESNLEQVLNVLRSLGPVVVIIDEADASLGSREADGDSGTSSRVFAMIASQMGDTRYRGKIVWMLLTSRPDLLPIDLKRQGRAEVHIPLFYPLDDTEVAAMVKAMAKKNKVTLAEDAKTPTTPPRALSGSDIESLLLAAARIAAAAGRPAVSSEDLRSAWHDFIPSAQGLEKEKQEIAAVLECTQKRFLPDDWRAIVDEPDGRAKLQRKFSDLKTLIEG